MFGKTRRRTAFYACAPKKGQPVPDGHPGSLWVQEGVLLDGLNDFLAHHVFGRYRRQLLDATLREVDQSRQLEHQERIAAVERAIAEISQRRFRLVRALELAEVPDQELLNDISRRRAELAAEHRELTEQLQQLRDTEPQQANPDLLDQLPIGPCDIAALPEPLARRLFEALRLEIHYDKTAHTGLYRIALAATNMPTTTATAHEAITTTTDGPTAVSDADVVTNDPDRFPSVWCPRQDSNGSSCAGGSDQAPPQRRQCSPAPREDQPAGGPRRELTETSSRLLAPPRAVLPRLGRVDPHHPRRIDMSHRIHHSMPGDGTELTAAGATHTVKVGAAATDGQYELFEIDLPRGENIPLHRHAWLECYYVLRGRVAARVSDERFELTPGAALTVPPHTPHTLSAVTPSAQVLVFTLTDAMGRFFADLHRALPAGSSPDQSLPLLMEVTRRHGVTFEEDPAMA